MPRTSQMTAALLLLLALPSCIGTESGNPPFTTDEAIRIDMRDGELEVVGDPGAVTPSDAEVQLINTEAASAPVVVAVAEDGSFMARLAGSADHEVRLVALRDRLRSAVLSLQAIENDPASTDCVRLSRIDADVESGAPARVDLINGCTATADVSVALRQRGVSDLDISPSDAFAIPSGERRTLTLETSTTPDALTPEVLEYTVTVDGASAPRRISVFLR
ncbi:MAG: hypothetical protein AB8I08_02135 [Sandaracinaceae bacterium]